jgi:hypothetical protein
MINTLFSSRTSGTKRFQYEGVTFGWKAIEDMYARESERRTAGRARMVPKLREAHEIPGLNLMSILLKSCKYVIYLCTVHSLLQKSKLLSCMQQEQVLTELFHYVNQSPPPDNALSVTVNYTLKYFEACNKLFEVGFLSSLRVSGAHREVLVNIQSGYHFFTMWLDLLLKGVNVTLFPTLKYLF